MQKIVNFLGHIVSLEVEFLGHIVSEVGIGTDPDKTEKEPPTELNSPPPPQPPTELNSPPHPPFFIGTALKRIIK